MFRMSEQQEPQKRERKASLRLQESEDEVMKKIRLSRMAKTKDLSSLQSALSSIPDGPGILEVSNLIMYSY